jgi:hypothetical protein
VRATLFPLAAIAAGVIGIAAAWRRPVVTGWTASIARLAFAVVAAVVVAWAGGWRGAAAAFVGARGAVIAGALAPAATAAVALLAFGGTAQAFLSFGYDEATWQVFAGVAAGLGAGAALSRRDGDGASGRYAAHALALAGVVVAGAAAPSVANRLDAVALPAYVAAAAVLAGVLTAGLGRLTVTAVARTIGAATFAAAVWMVSRWFDPVLLGTDGRPLPPSQPLLALGAGAATGLVAALLLRAPRAGWRTAALLAVLAGGALGTYAAAGPYGVGLAAVCAVAVAGLLVPDWTA